MVDLAELQAILADAARYRWLKDSYETDLLWLIQDDQYLQAADWDDRLDAMIDQQLQREKT